MIKIIAILTIMTNNYYFEPQVDAISDAYMWASTQYACTEEYDLLSCEYICFKNLEWLDKSDVIASIPACGEVLK